MISIIFALAFNALATQPLHITTLTHAPGSCHYRFAANGMELPDPTCTPGAINPTLTAKVLLDPSFRTGMVRDRITSEQQKRSVYGWYGVVEPKNNTGATQMCELDHLVDLASGGADSLDNIWPECQPRLLNMMTKTYSPVSLIGEREFKIKDRFAEHNVVNLIKQGPGDLTKLQHEIAEDWTQFIK